MVTSISANVRVAAGEDLAKAMQRLEPVTGKFRIIRQAERLLTRIIDVFKTGEWTTNKQVCVRLDRDVKRLTKLLEEDDQMIAKYPTQERASNDLEDRKAVADRGEKIFAIMKKLAERQPKTEFNQLVKDWDKLMQMNAMGMEHDLEILEESPKLDEGVIQRGFESRREAVEKGRREEMEFGIRRGKGEDAARTAVAGKREALPFRQAGIAIAGALPKLIEHAYARGIDKQLTDKENEMLQALTRERLNRMDLGEVREKGLEVINLINRGFFNKKERVPDTLRQELDVLRRHIQSIPERIEEPKKTARQETVFRTKEEHKLEGALRGVERAATEARKTVMKVRGKRLKTGLETAKETKATRETKKAAMRSVAENMPKIISMALANRYQTMDSDFQETRLNTSELQFLRKVSQLDWSRLPDKTLMLRDARRALDLINFAYNNLPPVEIEEPMTNVENNIKRLTG